MRQFGELRRLNCAAYRENLDGAVRLRAGFQVFEVRQCSSAQVGAGRGRGVFGGIEG
jgi:hypothetical protein